MLVAEDRGDDLLDDGYDVAARDESCFDDSCNIHGFSIVLVLGCTVPKCRNLPRADNRVIGTMGRHGIPRRRSSYGSLFSVLESTEQTLGAEECVRKDLNQCKIEGNFGELLFLRSPRGRGGGEATRFVLRDANCVAS